MDLFLFIVLKMFWKGPVDFDNARKCKGGIAHIQNPRYLVKICSYKLNGCYS